MKADITVPMLGRALAVRGLSRSEFSARSGLTRETIGFAINGRPITPPTFKAIVAALDLCPVSAIAHELGAGVAEAPTVGGPGS